MEKHTYRQWSEIALKSVISGGTNALVAAAYGRNADGAFWTGTMLAFSGELYTDYVRETAQKTGALGDGGDPYKKRSSDMVAHGYVNDGQVWDSKGFWVEGDGLSRFLDAFMPFMRPTSYLHDVWQFSFRNNLCLGSSMCIPLTVPAYIVSTMAVTSYHYTDIMLVSGTK